MTNRGSGRTRGRWARLAALSLTTILASGLAAPAMAQSPHPNLDANGVDLTTGQFNLRVPIASVGGGQAELPLVAFDGQKDNWSEYLLSVNTVGGVVTYTVSLGTSFDTFTGSGTTSTRGTGATLTPGGSGMVYRTLDGVAIDFSNAGIVYGGASNLCDTNNNTNCFMLPGTIAGKSGMAVSFGWDIYSNCTEGEIGGENPPDCTHSWRLAGVANRGGYGIYWTFATDSVTSGSNPGTDWFRKTAATLKNSGTTTGSIAYASPSAGVFTITTPSSKTWRITGSGNVITAVRRPGAASDTTTVSRSGGNVTSVTRDGITTGYNRTVSGSTATMVVTDALSNTTTIVSDMNKYRPTSITDGRGKITTMTWDSVGRPTEIAYPEGNNVQYGYDSRGNLTTTTRKAKSGSGLTDTFTQADYDTTCFNVAKCNSPNWVQDAMGNKTDYSYDSTTGLLLSETAPAPTTGAKRPQTRYSYTTNAAGVTLLTGVSRCQTGAVSDPTPCTGTADEVKTTIGYDANLNVTSVTQADGATTPTLSATTTATYDNVGNLLTVDGPLPGTADTATFRYDADRNRVGAISPDPDGAGARKRRAVKTTYNSDNQPTVVEVGTVNGTSDSDWAAFVSAQQVTSTYNANAFKTKDVVTASAATYQVRQYSYDAVGRVECTALRMNSATWGSLPASACTLGTAGSYGNDRIVKTSYDAVGHVTKTQTGYGVSGGQADEATTAYSDNGQVQSVTDAEGNKTSYSYDGFDRLSKTSYPSTTKGAGTSSSTDYEELIYDANDNVVTRRLRGYSSDVTKQIGFAYDKLDRVALKDLPGSEPDVSYTYDLLGRMTGASQTGHALSFGYDALSRNTSQGGPLGTVSYLYDAAGRRVRMTWPDTYYVTYDYLVTGETAAIRENGASSGAGVLATFGYDDLGRRTSLVRGNGTSTAYGYDAISRLSTLSHDLASTTYDVTTSFSYSPANQIVSLSRTNDAYAWKAPVNTARNYVANGLNQYSSAGGVALTYDAPGNVTGSGSDTYVYNSENLLTSATVASTSSTFTYDPAMRLFSTTGGNRFQYDGVDAIGDYNSSGTLLRHVIFGPGADEPVAITGPLGSNSRVWPFADERGSVLGRIDANGAPISGSIGGYDEFGIPDTTSARFGYTGQVFLPSVGLSYYKARMYSPTLGRFMQTDPIGYGDGMNWYAYVGNDPVNKVDPSGTDCRAVDVGYSYYNGNTGEYLGPAPGKYYVLHCDGHVGFSGGGFAGLTGEGGIGNGDGNVEGEGLVVTGALESVSHLGGPDPKSWVDRARDICIALLLCVGDTQNGRPPFEKPSRPIEKTVPKKPVQPGPRVTPTPTPTPTRPPLPPRLPLPPVILIFPGQEMWMTCTLHPEQCTIA